MLCIDRNQTQQPLLCVHATAWNALMMSKLIDVSHNGSHNSTVPNFDPRACALFLLMASLMYTVPHQRSKPSAVSCRKKFVLVINRRCIHSVPAPFAMPLSKPRPWNQNILPQSIASVRRRRIPSLLAIIRIARIRWRMGIRRLVISMMRLRMMGRRVMIVAPPIMTALPRIDATTS